MPSAAPEAARRIVIAGQAVAYQLRRSQRRTIGISIDNRGLRVGAPKQARIGDIENLIHQHSAWVLDKLANWRERPAPEKLEISDGSEIFIILQIIKFIAVYDQFGISKYSLTFCV